MLRYVERGLLTTRLTICICLTVSRGRPREISTSHPIQLKRTDRSAPPSAARGVEGGSGRHGVTM